MTVAGVVGLGFLYARRLTHHAEPTFSDINTWKSPHKKYPYPPQTDVLDRHVLGKLATEKLSRNLDSYVDYKKLPLDPTKLPHVERIK